ncbi:MAG: PAS domain S-box protein [Gemmataceae bacterium]|nr:PAS domain S-box protein [Gemmataceae bacterium]
MFGFGPGELLGKSARVLNSYPKEENDRVVSAITAELRAKGYWAGETRNHRKDGTPFSTRAVATVLQLGDRPLVLSVQEDVTQIRQAEEQVRLLLESTGEGIVGIDLEGQCTFINRSACAMLGLQPAETIGRRLHELVQTSGDTKIETCDANGKLREGVDAVVRHGIQQDAMHFIQKPFALEQLVRKVREVLDAG